MLTATVGWILQIQVVITIIIFLWSYDRYAKRWSTALGRYSVAKTPLAPRHRALTVPPCAPANTLSHTPMRPHTHPYTLRYVRLVAVLGTIQQHAASGDAQVVVEALRWVLQLLFGSGGNGVDGERPHSSRWLRLNAIMALNDWLHDDFGPGGVVANMVRVRARARVRL